MDVELLNQPIDDKPLADEIRKLAADKIRWLLRQHDSNLMPDEKKLRNDILRSLAPNLFPRPKEDAEIPDEETKLTDDQKEQLNKILDG